MLKALLFCIFSFLLNSNYLIFVKFLYFVFIVLLSCLSTTRVNSHKNGFVGNELDTHKTAIQAKNSNEDIIRWRNEIIGFLKLNIYQCKYQTLMYNQFNNRSDMESSADSDLLVYFRYPSGGEVQSYRKLPSTLSAANGKLLNILNAPRFIEMEKEQGYKWMIPRTHVGHNSSLCIGLTKLLATGNVVKLYDQYKIIQKVSYIVVGKNALIHPRGFVMFDCGSYQGIDGCETRWDHELTEWRDPCRNIVRDSKLSWGEFLTRITREKNRYLVIKRKFNFFKIESITVQSMLEKCSFALNDAVRQEIPPQNFTMPISYNKVMVITASFDNNFHHMISDSLIRFGRYLTFLRRNTDILIHMREFELTRPSSFTLYDDEVNMATQSRVRFLKLLGIDPSRIIHGPVTANTVYIPRETSCSYILRNPLELRQLSSQLIKSTKQWMKKRVKRDASINYFKFEENNIKESIIPHNIYYQADDPNYNYHSKKNIIILHRQGWNSAWGNRMWGEDQITELLQAFQNAFPDHVVIRHPSATVMHKDYCLACEINELMNTDILVGVHGAGMTKEMFMPPGGLVVELSGHFNDVQMPVCGYYGNIASIFGHHHYLYGYDKENGNKEANGRDISEELNPLDLVDTIKKYYDFIHSTEAVNKLAISIDKSIYPYT